MSVFVLFVCLFVIVYVGIFTCVSSVCLFVYDRDLEIVCLCLFVCLCRDLHLCVCVCLFVYVGIFNCVSVFVCLFM